MGWESRRHYLPMSPTSKGVFLAAVPAAIRPGLIAGPSVAPAELAQGADSSPFSFSGSFLLSGYLTSALFD